MYRAYVDGKCVGTFGNKAAALAERDNWPVYCRFSVRQYKPRIRIEPEVSAWPSHKKSDIFQPED